MTRTRSSRTGCSTVGRDSAENVPAFTSNELVKTWTIFDSDLKVFYKLICSPFELPMHRIGLERYSKFAKPLNVKLKLTHKGRAPFNYNPAKHNVFYFRAKKMLLTLMLKHNTVHLQNTNPHFMNVFCRLRFTEMRSSPKMCSKTPDLSRT